MKKTSPTGGWWYFVTFGYSLVCHPSHLSCSARLLRQPRWVLRSWGVGLSGFRGMDCPSGSLKNPQLLICATIISIYKTLSIYQIYQIYKIYKWSVYTCHWRLRQVCHSGWYIHFRPPTITVTESFCGLTYFVDPKNFGRPLPVNCLICCRGHRHNNRTCALTQCLYAAVGAGPTLALMVPSTRFQWSRLKVEHFRVSTISLHCLDRDRGGERQRARNPNR